MARPRIDIDTDQFKKLCAIQCTLSEISSWFKCSEDTIERWCKRELKMSFADAFKTWSADGKISLRRNQFKMAEHNVSMAIWLGKQYLGQKEQQDLGTRTAAAGCAVRKRVTNFTHIIIMRVTEV